MANLKQRFLKIEWLKNTILSFFKETPKEKIDKDKLIAQFCVAFNSTERTARECLRVLEGTGVIKTDGAYIINGS